MKEYNFFLSILPYQKGHSIKYTNELKKLYHLYQQYQSHGLLQEDILKEPEFSQLENILLLNELKFSHNFSIQNVNQKTIDFLNQLYDYFPEYFNDVHDENIYQYKQKIIRKLPSFNDEKLTKKRIIPFKSSFQNCFNYSKFLLFGFLFSFMFTIITVLSNTTIPHIFSFDAIKIILFLPIFSTLGTFIILWLFISLTSISSYIQHKNFKYYFSDNFIEEIKHYQKIPNNINYFLNRIGYSDTNIVMYKINHLIESNPNIKWDTYNVYSLNDLEKAFESMKMTAKQYI